MCCLLSFKMRSCKIFFLSVCAALLFMAASGAPVAALCGEPPEDKPDISGPVPAFKQHKRAKRVEANVHFTAVYPEFGIDLLDQVIQKQVSDLIRENGGFESFAVEMGRNELGEIIPREYSLGYALHAPKPGIVCIVFSDWAFLGGPHGHPNVYAFAWDLRLKRKLRLKDIFPRWESAQKALLALVKDPDWSLDEECPSLDLNAVITPDDTGFYLGPEGLTLVNAMGYAPPSHWVCALLPVDKATLEEMGADMQYWEE